MLTLLQSLKSLFQAFSLSASVTTLDSSPALSTNSSHMDQWNSGTSPRQGCIQVLHQESGNPGSTCTMTSCFILLFLCFSSHLFSILLGQVISFEDKNTAKYKQNLFFCAFSCCCSVGLFLQIRFSCLDTKKWPADVHISENQNQDNYTSTYLFYQSKSAKILQS